MKMSLKISEEDFKNQQASYEIIKSKVEGGLSPKVELFQAEVNLASVAKLGLQNQQVSLANAMDNFRQYIGMPLNEEFEIKADVEFDKVEVDLAKALRNGLDTRMELRQREISMKNSLDDLTVAKATNEFNGNLNLAVGLSGDDPQFPHVYDKPTRSPNILVTFTIPIWDWGVRKSRIKAAEVSMRIEEINTQCCATV